MSSLERITGNVSLKRYFNSEYIGAYSIDEGVEPVLTIDSLWFGEITLAGGRKEEHVLVKFVEKKVPGVDEVKPLVLNATNRKTLKKLYGSDSADVLEGKKIQLYIDPKVRDPQDGGFTEGLRIRPVKPRDQEPVPACEACGGNLKAYGSMSPAKLAAYTKEKYGRVLCADCAKKESESREPAAEVSENVE